MHGTGTALGDPIEVAATMQSLSHDEHGSIVRMPARARRMEA